MVCKSAGASSFFASLGFPITARSFVFVSRLPFSRVCVWLFYFPLFFSYTIYMYTYIRDIWDTFFYGRNKKSKKKKKKKIYFDLDSSNAFEDDIEFRLLFFPLELPSLNAPKKTFGPLAFQSFRDFWYAL